MDSEVRKWKEKNKINTGRQKELDDAKGFLVVGIVLIHAFQAFENESAYHTS